MKITPKIFVSVLTLIMVSIAASFAAVYLWLQSALPGVFQQTEDLGADLWRIGLIVAVVIGFLACVVAFILSRHLTQPLTTLSETALAISNGDFNSSLSIRRSDEIGTLAQSCRTMRNTLDRVLEEMAELVLAVQEGKLDSRGNAETFSGDWRELIGSVNTVLDAFSAPFSVTVSSLERIAKGEIPNRVMGEYKGGFEQMLSNLNLLIDAMNEVTWMAVMIAGGNLDLEARERSEDDRLMKAFNMMISQLNTILQETNSLTESVQNGDLTLRGNTEDLTGGWSKLVTGLNSVVDAFTVPILTSATSLERISRGDIPPKITQEYKGDFNKMKDNLNSMIDTNRGLLREINGTTQAIQEGRLDARIHTENLNGDWKELGQGINNVIEAFAAPINLAAGAIARIAEGDIPAPIHAEYKGDFNEIIHNLNLLITNMQAILQEVGGLIHAVEDGKLDVRGQADAFVGDWQELVSGINTVIEAFVSPINMAASTIDRIGRGDIPDLIADEGEYQGDFRTIRQNLNLLITATNDVTALATEMAEGKLELEVHERSEHDTLMQAMNAMIQQTKEVVANMKMAADTVALGSTELSSSAVEVSQGASQQASAMEEVTASMQEMASNIRQSVENVRQTETIARQSAEYAEEGGKVVSEAVAAMKLIAEKILIIEEIAMQTRLLSLNATIEAARAQEHGKAFSVVAAEVRKLADTTRTAAEEISQLAGSSLVVSQKAGEMLATLVPSIHRTSELVQEISSATNEQSVGIGQITNAIHQLDNVTQQNASTADDMASTSEALAAQAKQLQDSVSFFQLGTVKQELSRQSAICSSSKAPHPAEEDRTTSDTWRSGGTIGFEAERRKAGSVLNIDDREEEFERF